MDEVNNLNCWKEFLDDLVKHFGKNLYDLHVGKLGRVVKTSSVSEYQHRFKAMTTKVHGILEEMERHMYINGLKSDLQKDLVMTRLANIIDAFILAIVYEGQAKVVEGNKQMVAWDGQNTIANQAIIDNKLTPL